VRAQRGEPPRLVLVVVLTVLAAVVDVVVDAVDVVVVWWVTIPSARKVPYFKSTKL